MRIFFFNLLTLCGAPKNTIIIHLNIIRLRGYKTFPILNLAEHEIVPAHKCSNANKCWHFNIYEPENSIIGLSEPE